MPAALGIHHLIIRESSPQFLAPLSFGDLSSRFSVSTRCDKFLNYHVRVKHLAPCGLHRASHDTHASTASERAAHHHGGRRRSLAEATGVVYSAAAQRKRSSWFESRRRAASPPHGRGLSHNNCHRFVPHMPHAARVPPVWQPRASP